MSYPNGHCDWIATLMWYFKSLMEWKRQSTVPLIHLWQFKYGNHCFVDWLIRRIQLHKIYPQPVKVGTIVTNLASSIWNKRSLLLIYWMALLDGLISGYIFLMIYKLIISSRMKVQYKRIFWVIKWKYLYNIERSYSHKIFIVLRGMFWVIFTQFIVLFAIFMFYYIFSE